MLFKHQSLKVKIIFLNAESLVLLDLIVGFMVYLLLHQNMKDYAIANQETNMRVAWSLVKAKGTEFKVFDNVMYFGDYKINDQFEIVDKVKELSGSTATIFMGDTRVSTNVIKPDGSRAVGTKLAAGPAYDSIFGKGQSYRGEVDILGQKYFAAYDPIKDNAGKVIGVLYTGIKKSDFFSIIDQIIINIVGIAALTALAFSAIFFPLISRLFRPLQALTGLSSQIAEGDLTTTIETRSKDEIGQLSNAMRGMLLSLRQLARNARESTAPVSAAASEIASGSSDLAQRTEEQASALEETASSMEQLTGTVKQSADNAGQANQLASAPPARQLPRKPPRPPRPGLKSPPAPRRPNPNVLPLQLLRSGKSFRKLRRK